jgi:hypothetical protein
VNRKERYSSMIIQTLLIISVLCVHGCSKDFSTPSLIESQDELPVRFELAGPGERVFTHIHCLENGNIAIRVDVPQDARYGQSAPVVVVASTWFVEKYSQEEVGFHLVYNPVDVGAITVTHLWPGKMDPETKIRSDGVYDYGGPDSLAALRDTIRFALGDIPNTDGHYLHELIGIKPLYENVGMFASSHAGVVATNVMAYHGLSIRELKYFVGRENPTMAEMYPLEIGHFDDRRRPIYNPYYLHEGYTPTSIEVDYSHLGWIQNETYPEGRPIFQVEGARDYVLDDKGPRMEGKRYFSHALTQALLNNGIFTLDHWPDDVASPDRTREFWPYRTPIDNYEAIGEQLPDLKVLITFASKDHVQAARDKPHIRQAYDGFRKRAGLWTRLNCDLSYVQNEIDQNASLSGGFPDNDANTEPMDWFTQAESWGFADKLAGELTARTVPLAGVAEMADRVQSNIWTDNLSSVIEVP